MARLTAFARFVAFCRAGYPVGVPATGHLPLFALLKRRLGADEIERVAARCCDAGPPILPADIDTAISAFLGEPPCAGDTDRVGAHLAGNGWLVVDAAGRPLPCVVGTVFADVCRLAVDWIPGADVAAVRLVRDGRAISIGGTADLPTEVVDGEHLSLPISIGESSAATLDVFGRRAEGWGQDAEIIGTVLAIHAAAALEARCPGTVLAAPTHDCDRVSQAKGVIMGRFGLDAVSAFGVLSGLAAEAAVGIVEMAGRVIDTR
jgi:hypothetical protein